MLDREKVIKELNESLELCDVDDNPNGSVAVKIWAVCNSLEFLNEQETKPPIHFHKEYLEHDWKEERVTININDKIKVKLTAHGERIRLEYYYRYLKNMQMVKDCIPKKDAEGYTEYQLWEFANIFGEYLYNGAKQVIENNEMTLL